MRQECIQVVQQAAQRTLTAREIQNIEDRIYRNMRSIARDDPVSWRQLSESERLYRAAQLASEELQREAACDMSRSRYDKPMYPATPDNIKITATANSPSSMIHLRFITPSATSANTTRIKAIISHPYCGVTSCGRHQYVWLNSFFERCSILRK
jgi:hypothetical protein